MKPIRVLHVVDRLNRGGAETMIMNIYRHIDKKKIQFDFLVHSNEKSDYDEEVITLGGKIFKIPRFKIINIYEYKKSIDSFFSTNSEYKIIHCHMASIASILFASAKKFNIPIRIIHSHNAAVDSKVREIIKNIIRNKIIKNSNVFFSCSDKSIQWLLGDNINLDKVDIIKNGINLNEFKFSESERYTMRNHLGIEDKFVIGHVGRFTKMKNHKFLIEVFNLIQKNKDNAVLLLVGRGELEKDVILQINNLNLNDKVIFLGVREDINKLMQAMDVFLFPSLQEGLGIVLLEAQASGLKCFTSKNVVPNDIAITDLVEFIDLNEDINIWKNKVLNIKPNYERISRIKELENEGYNIVKTSKDIELKYLELLNKRRDSIDI